MKMPLWTLIPALMLYTLLFFKAFAPYTLLEYITANGVVALGIGLIYLGEAISNKYRGGLKW